MFAYIVTTAHCLSQLEGTLPRTGTLVPLTAACPAPRTVAGTQQAAINIS